MRRVRKVAWSVTRAVLTLLFFGAVVSATSYSRTASRAIASMADSSVRIDEVTRLYPVTVERVVTPRTVEEISQAVAASPGPISIGGGRYSMGGQTATPNGLQLDMREFHGVVSIDTSARTVVVRSGTRWRELQSVLDTLGFAVKIMQTYNTFTVGGALSVNAHGRYIGQGPLIRSVREITLVLADGSVVTASPTQNSALFFGAIGGYGSLGVIAHVTLDMARNTRVKRTDSKMALTEYLDFFRKTVRDDSNVVFHNADIYPMAFENVHVVTYRNTQDSVTVRDRMLPLDQSSWTHRSAYNAISSGDLGKSFREHILDPFLFRGEPVTWRNYEASYDVSELEPASREFETYVLQEYFVPIDSVVPFVARMGSVLQKHEVNVVNVSIRHALPDNGSNLAWAPTEVFAFVLYYNQRTDPNSRREVAKWTRELIDAAIASGGRYYLPYQPVATRAQFLKAYPNAPKLFETKRKVDPTAKFTNALWDMYRPADDGSAPLVSVSRSPATLPAEVRVVLDTLPNYARSEGSEFLTHPEWDLVYSSEAYAGWLEAGKKPSAFPYIGSVGTFWRSYRDTYNHAKTRYEIATGTHVMLNVIGVSTAIEYGIKGVYEGTVGRFFELFMPEGGTAEDKYAAVVARDYAKLITTKGWYEFSFSDALGKLWSDVPLTGPGFLRKWERRFALSSEFLIKAAYASVIGAGTAAGYTPDQLTRYAVVAGWSDSLGTTVTDAPRFRKVASLDRGYTLIAVNRYNPYRDALLDLSDHADSVRIVEVSGADIVTVSGTAPAGWQTRPRSGVVVSYAMPDDSTRTRMLLRVNARDLLDVLARLRRENEFRVEHIYDY